MRTSLVALLLGTASLSLEPLVLAPSETAFVQNGSCPNGKVVKNTVGQASTQSMGELESVKSVSQRAISTIPGKKMTAVVVSYPPGGKSPPHRHAKSAFIYAFVLSGAIRNGIDSERPAVYQAGDSFYEEPGAHHTVSENASETQPASLLAVFILDAEDHPLTLPDPTTDRQ